MKLEADTTQFNRMIGELSVVLSSPPDDVLREEVGRVLTAAINNTDAASAESIKRHSAEAKFTLQPATIYTPQARARKRTVRSRGGKVLYNLKFHYPDRLWAAIQRARALDLKRRLAARGLAKQSWYKIGQMLGLRVDAPEYVRKAVPRTGRQYQDEQTQTQKGASSVSITIMNSQPTVNAIGGAQALQRAIDGRSKYFAANIIHGVFQDMAAIAKKYPGVRIN